MWYSIKLLTCPRFRDVIGGGECPGLSPPESNIHPPGMVRYLLLSSKGHPANRWSCP